MKKAIAIFLVVMLVTASWSFIHFSNDPYGDSLRKIYSRSSDQWPRPFIDEEVQWKELGILPVGPLQSKADSFKHIIELGKILFFDPRLSSSQKISCASCHQPERSWTDGKEKSIGHEGAINKRNSPTIQNVWFYKKLFWDGRARDLEDQAFAPINSESEMHGDMRQLPRNLRKIKGYEKLFDSAFGDPGIDPDRIATALAYFQRTISSDQSRFDAFIQGQKKALTNEELKGMHLFRTRARCMNCHHGPMFSDNDFHNNGFHYYENGFMDSSRFDKGLYHVTHDLKDFGKFKTPSLRDVMHTGPWMHHGKMTSVSEVIRHYNKGASGNGGADAKIRMLNLTEKEQQELVAFLNALSAPPIPFQKPVLPE